MVISPALRKPSRAVFLVGFSTSSSSQKHRFLMIIIIGSNPPPTTTTTPPPLAPLDMREQRESTVAANKRSIAIMKSADFSPSGWKHSGSGGDGGKQETCQSPGEAIRRRLKQSRNTLVWAKGN